MGYLRWALGIEGDFAFPRGSPSSSSSSSSSSRSLSSIFFSSSSCCSCASHSFSSRQEDHLTKLISRTLGCEFWIEVVTCKSTDPTVDSVELVSTSFSSSSVGKELFGSNLPCFTLAAYTSSSKRRGSRSNQCNELHLQTTPQRKSIQSMSRCTDATKKWCSTSD